MIRGKIEVYNYTVKEKKGGEREHKVMIFSLLVYAWVTKGEPPDKDRNDDNDNDENNKACPFFLKIYIHNQKTRHKKVGK